MSRIGRAPITLPKGVTVTIDGNTIAVKGPRGELRRTVPAAMTVSQEDGVVTVTRPSDENEHRALHGLTRSLVNNMVEGVTKGFQKQLDIVGVGYKAEARPYGLQLALGFSHAIEYKAPEGIKLSAPNPTTIIVDGANKEVVGQVAAEIRSFRPPEPYKGKGVKYQGEVVRRKAGKAGGK
jgi:large subunit ribosomal protein L6